MKAAHSMSEISKRRTRSTGFTMLEIMLAIAVFGMVLVTIYSVWVMILRATESGRKAAAEAQRERVAMRTIEEALSCVQSFNESIQYYGFVADNSESRLSFVARLPGSFPRSGRFGDLTTRRVEFSLEAGRDFGKDLVLRQAPIVMDFDEDEMNHPLVLGKNIEKMSFEFLDPRKNEWIDEWTQTNQVPKLIKVNLRFNGGGPAGSYSTAPDREASRIIALPAMTVPSYYQTGVQQGPGQPGQPGAPGVPGRPGLPNPNQQK